MLRCLYNRHRLSFRRHRPSFRRHHGGFLEVPEDGLDVLYLFSSCRMVQFHVLYGTGLFFYLLNGYGTGLLICPCCGRCCF